MKPHTFDSYKDRYDSISLERTDDGILQMTVHAPGDPTKPLIYGGIPWGWDHPQVEWTYCFNDIARDYDNEVVIVTGTGDSFNGAHAIMGEGPTLVGRTKPVHPLNGDRLMSNARKLQLNYLDIECPVIGAINGPALTHAEIVVLSDIVICAENASFQDNPHFPGGVFAPGDGVGLVWPLLLGENRGRHFLYTGKKIDAEEALRLGVVAEVLPREDLLARAYVLAREIMLRPKLMRRLTRQMLTQRLKESMQQHLSYSLPMEMLTGAGRVLDADVAEPVASPAFALRQIDD